MFFIAKNPLTAPKIRTSPSVPKAGTRGLFAGEDGWYEIDSDGKETRVATAKDIESLADIYQKKFATINIKGGIDNWVAESVEDDNGNIIGSRYGQRVTVNNATITPNSKVDLQVSSEQMIVFYEKSLAFVAENEDAVVTVYCVGGVPENDYTVQAIVTEVMTSE